MENNILSVQSLVHKNVNVVKNYTGIIDVKSLLSIKKSYDDIYLFNPDQLIKSRIEKREKILSTYMKIYKSCLEKIKMFESMNRVDMVFEIPQYMVDTLNYNPNDCLDYIRNKLTELFIDTYKISNKLIFITWKYIELNKDNIMKQIESQDNKSTLT